MNDALFPEIGPMTKKFQSTKFQNNAVIFTESSLSGFRLAFVIGYFGTCHSSLNAGLAFAGLEFDLLPREPGGSMLRRTTVGLARHGLRVRFSLQKDNLGE